MILSLFNEFFAIYMLFQIHFMHDNLTEYASSHTFIVLIFALTFAYSIFKHLEGRIHSSYLIFITICLISGLTIPYHINLFLNQLHAILCIVAVIGILIVYTYFISIFYHSYFILHFLFLCLILYLFFYFGIINGLIEIIIITYINLLILLNI